VQAVAIGLVVGLQLARAPPAKGHACQTRRPTWCWRSRSSTSRRAVGCAGARGGSALRKGESRMGGAAARGLGGCRGAPVPLPLAARGAPREGPPPARPAAGAPPRARARARARGARGRPPTTAVRGSRLRGPPAWSRPDIRATAPRRARRALRPRSRGRQPPAPARAEPAWSLFRPRARGGGTCGTRARGGCAARQDRNVVLTGYPRRNVMQAWCTGFERRGARGPPPPRCNARAA
jgi:hypothetical protein